MNLFDVENIIYIRNSSQNIFFKCSSLQIVTTRGHCVFVVILSNGLHINGSWFLGTLCVGLNPAVWWMYESLGSPLTPASARYRSMST